MKKVIGLLLASMLLLGSLAGCSTGAGNETPAEAAVEKGDEANKALLVVSFGTSYNDTRAVTIEATEKVLADAHPDYEFVRAFTAQIIIDKLQERDGLEIFNVEQAMDYLVENDFGTLVVQPLHVMNGAEYDDLMAVIGEYEDNFADIKIGKPLLSSTPDFENIVGVVAGEMPELQEGEALLFMGHGTHHDSNAVYSALDYMFKYKGYEDVYVGTVEGFPTLDSIIEQIEDKNYTKLYLMPFMIVAGDHANNDMAGDEEDAWKMILKAEGYDVEPVLMGLGQMEGIQKMYLDHLDAAIAGKHAE
jgi:sirohydrochlorin cobaltochelatase